MKQKVQYYDNTAMVRSFLSKPLTLIVAIIFTSNILLNLLLPVIQGNKPSFDLVSILFALGFFLIYSKAKKNMPYENFSGSLNFIRISSIILTIILGLANLVSLIAIPSAISYMNSISGGTGLLALILVFAGVILFFAFLYYLGLSLTFGSMRKTLKQHEIKTRGSMLCGVSGILFTVLTIALLLFIYLMIEEIAESISSLMYDLFMSMLNESPSIPDFEIPSILSSDLATKLFSETSGEVFSSANAASDSSSSNIPTALILIFSLLSMVITSIFAISYNSCAKNADIDSTAVPAPSTPSSNTSSSYSNPAFVTPPHLNPPPRQNNYGGPARPATMNYSRALAPEINFGDDQIINDRRICPTCGSKVELSLDFCPQCGFKFIIKEELPAKVEDTPAEAIETVAPVEPISAPVQNVDPFAPVAPVQTPDPFAPVAPVQNPDPFAPAAPAQNPDPFAPVAPVQNPDPFAPVAPVQNPDPFAPAAPAQNPDPFAPVAPAQNPDPFAPVAPAQNPDPFAPVAPAQNPDPFAPVAPAQNPDPFVAPFETVNTIPNQQPYNPQPFVAPFQTTDSFPSRPKKKDDDGPKPYISNSNLRR